MAKKTPDTNDQCISHEQALEALGDVLSRTMFMLRDCLTELDKGDGTEALKNKLASLQQFNETAYREVFVDRRVPTAHQRQRQGLIDLFQNMVNGFCHNRIVLDEDRNPVDFVILEANRGMEDMLGMSRRDMTGKPFFQLFPDLPLLAVRGVRDRLAHMLKAGKFTFEDEGYFPPLNKWFLISGFSTGVGTFALLVYDVTKRKQVERALAQALQTIQEAVSARDRFLTALSHDIRIPVSSIRNTATAVQTLDQEGRFEQQCDVIARSCDHLLMMIDELTATRPATDQVPGQIPGRPAAGKKGEAFSPEQDLIGLCEEFRSRAEAKGLKIVAVREGRVPALVQGPRRGLYRILYNLLDNSLKFTDQGEVRVVISCPWAKGQKRLRLLLSINDTGPGLDDERLDDVFEPSVRVQNGQTDKPGSGLGLATARAIVRQVGGSLCLENQPGQGCTFHCLVPLAGVLRQEPDQQPVPLPACLLGTRLLLVEDNELNAEATASLLGAMGLKPLVASTAEKALETLARENPDMILMDIQLKDRDGLKLCRSIRDDESLGEARNLPIVGLSGHPVEEYRQRCLEAGMNAYLRKPLRRHDLVRVLEALLVDKEGVCELEVIGEPREEEPLFSVLLEEYGGQEVVVRTLLENFLKAYEQELAGLRAILKDKDAAALAKAAHRVKSSLYSIHAEAEADLAGKLEAEAKAGRLPKPELMLELEKRVADLAQAARAWLKR